MIIYSYRKARNCYSTSRNWQRPLQKPLMGRQVWIFTFAVTTTTTTTEKKHFDASYPFHQHHFMILKNFLRYKDKPIKKLLHEVKDAGVEHLDR